MKKLLAVCIFLISSTIFCQEKLIYVEYEHGQWLYSFSNKEILIAGKDKSRYDVQELKTVNKDKMVRTDEATGIINILPFKSIKPTTIYKIKKNSQIYFNQYITDDENQWFITDSIPEQNWKLVSGETKTIQGYVCNKAKLKFRGSEFTAYYTLEIPTTFGPWKFSGTPGLILEITLDDNPVFYWRANKIIYPYKQKIDFNFDKELYKTSYENFIINEDIARTERTEALIAKVAQGEPVSYSYKRVGPEKVYEWEEEKKK